MRMSRLLISVLCLLLSLPMVARAEGGNTEMEFLRKEMYRLYSTDSLEQFMDATDRLKEVAKREGQEEYFYKAWSNQALYIFRKKNRREGQEILQAEREYAESHHSKFGIYSATSVNITFLSMMKINDRLEEQLWECINLVHENFPNISVASDYITLARLYHNASQWTKVIDVSRQALKEPNLQDVHRQAALGYLCIGYSHLPEAEMDVSVFNKYYAEYQKYAEKTGRDFGMKGIVDYNYHRVNHNPKGMLEAAKTVSTKINRLHYLATAYAAGGDYMNAYLSLWEYKRYTDSLNTSESRKQATEHSLQLNIAKAENEAKDLRLANQSLQLEHIADELEQRRLEEETLNLSLQKRDAELAHAATKLQNDSLDKYNKEMQLREVQSKMEAQQSAQRARSIFVTMVGVIAALTIAYLAFYLRRRRKQMQELKSAYDQLEETTSAKERIESELRIARDIQMGMVHSTFPAYPDRQDIDLYALMEPAKEVGGDLYDFFLQGQKLYFCLGDVSGKGVPASMFMSVAVNLFRLVVKEGFPPSYVATRLNETLSDNNESGMFITMFIGEIDLSSGHMDYCNCGHNPPAIMTDGTYEFLDVRESNAPLGLWPDLEFAGESVDCVWNRPMLIYTDGVNEAENHTQEQFGDERLLRVLNHASQPFGERTPKSHSHFLVDELLQAVATHVDGAEPSDDMTMLCIEVKNDNIIRYKT